MQGELKDNPGKKRYEIWADGELAGFADYELERGRITFSHTEIDSEYEGSGLGSRLAAEVLDDARNRGLGVVPHCEFIASYIAGHEEYLDLVVPSLRARVRANG